MPDQARVTNLGYLDADTIEPIRIEHKVDDIIIDGELVESYNFIEYWFESRVGPVHARAYLDWTHTVTIMPSIQNDGGTVDIREDADARAKVVDYFTRRYLVIKEFTLQGPVAIWMALNARRVLERLGLSPNAC